MGAVTAHAARQAQRVTNCIRYAYQHQTLAYLDRPLTTADTQDGWTQMHEHTSDYTH